MSKTRRGLAVVGLSLVAGTIIGFTGTAANASPSTDSGKGQTQSVAERRGEDPGRQFRGRGDDRPRFDRGSGRNFGRAFWGWGHRTHYRYIDTYENRWECRWVGEFGEDRGWWDEYRCIPTWDGDYALFVERDGFRRGPGSGFRVGPR